MVFQACGLPSALLIKLSSVTAGSMNGSVRGELKGWINLELCTDASGELPEDETSEAVPGDFIGNNALDL